MYNSCTFVGKKRISWFQVKDGQNDVYLQICNHNETQDLMYQAWDAFESIGRIRNKHWNDDHQLIPKKRLF